MNKKRLPCLGLLIAGWMAMAGAISLRAEEAPTVFDEPGKGRVAVRVVGDVARADVWFYVVNDARLKELLVRAGYHPGNEFIRIERKGENPRRWAFRPREYDIRFDFAPGDTVMVFQQ